MKSSILKKIVMTVAGVAMIASAGMAGAATREINIYGASAQHLYWNAALPGFLADAGCTFAGNATDGTHGAAKGTSCTDFNNDTIIIRYSSKASYDGINAMKGVGNPDSCAGGNYFRKLRTDPDVATTVCKDVTLGASDVAGESFTQQSHGCLKGPIGTCAYSDFTFSGISTDGLTAYNPLVVPFGFFARNDVTVSTCVGGTNAGEQCSLNSHCNSNNCGAPAPITGISRMMAVQIYSGQAYNWTDFGAGYSPLPVVACMRHAGSGTHATLDYAVIKGNGWGANLATTQTAGGPTVWFNEKSGDMMACINTVPGAIGYADADQGNLANTMGPLAYNGFKPTRANIRNGLYDDFWSTQWIYEDPSEPNYALTHPVVVAMMNYASEPANVPTTKAGFWATKKEMNYMKGTDQEYPGYVGSTESPAVLP